MKYTSRIACLTIIILFINNLKSSWGASEVYEDKVNIRVSIQENSQKDIVQKICNSDIVLNDDNIFKTSVSWSQFVSLQKAGLNPDILVDIKRDKIIDSQFHSFKDVTSLLNYYNDEFPDILSVKKIGEGSVKKLPIWAVKISDNPHKDENEPAVLFNGLHHAKELLGCEVCLYLIKYLCENYLTNEEVAQWINNTEIWIIPVLNPDGLYLVMDEENSPQFWRKNLRDNNGNGVFDSDRDGVDINRNYDYNWADESDPNPKSWYFRGPYPFSEKETQAIRDLVLKEKIVFHLDYHSYGELVLYPWENYTPPPDKSLVIKLAKEISHELMKSKKFENYTIRPLNGRLGQSSVWMHGKACAQSFIIEVGDSHFPKEWNIQKIVEQNANAAFYVLNRLSRSVIKGITTNAYTNEPISAEIEIEKYASTVVENPVSDPVSGFYFRVVEAGNYTIKFTAPGFRTKIYHQIKVDVDKVTVLNVELFPIEDIFPTEN